jgi:hypothetical protein
MPALAFFPWLEIRAPLQLPGVRLIPYVANEHPGDCSYAQQCDIDLVLSAYADRPRIALRRATLVEVGKWKTGMELRSFDARLDRIQHAVAFSALSNRRLFQWSGLNYTNYDSFLLVVQRYELGNSRNFAFTSRRRDGNTTHQWASDEFAFVRPDHVPSHHKPKIDSGLLAAVLAQKAPGSQRILEAIREFNSANTDSPTTTHRSELVMVKTAFEWLLSAGSNASDLESKLLGVLKDIPSTEPPRWRKAWRDQWPDSRRPLAAWCREFCAMRGMAAHANESHRRPWSIAAHLAFGAILFPLLVKKVLSDSGHYKLSQVDTLRLAQLDAYIGADPMRFNRGPEMNRQHPWEKIDEGIEWKALINEVGSVM